MRRAFAIVLLCVLGFAAGALPAWAQATGSVTGLVTDESGAVVIFDAEDDFAIERARQSPDVDGVDDVPQVQPSSRGGREAGAGASGQSAGERLDVDGGRPIRGCHAV